MRIRSTKPEFWRSETIAQLDWDARLVLKGLESYVDDNGVGKDKVVIICADVFPHDLASDPETLARVTGALKRIAALNLIVRYQFGGEPLIYVRGWKSIQRVDHPNKGRYPRPDGTMEYNDDVDETVTAGSGDSCCVAAQFETKNSGAPRETLAKVAEIFPPGTEEQRNRGTEQKTGATPSRFDDFWATYPRRRDRRKAEKAFAAALKRERADVIIAGAHRYAADPHRVEQFTKYAEGWLNGDGWLDEPLPSRSSAPAARKVAAGLDLAQKLASQPNYPELMR